MKSRHSLLPIAVSLVACLWAPASLAQPVTMPVTLGQESGPPVHAGIATHHTGELPGTVEIPADAALDSATALKQQALTAMETLREEIATLAALKSAQTALLAWNRDRTEAGEASESLDATLCKDPAIGAWCRLLPATFGTLKWGERSWPLLTSF